MEHWKTIEGFEAYEVSDLGRVRRVVTASNKHRLKVLKPRNDGGDYLHVALYSHGKRHEEAIHRLVASAFLPNPKKLPEVNHLGPTLDNRTFRLEWRTKIGNARHAVKTGLYRGDGISYRKDLRMWQARYTPMPNKRKSLGMYHTREEAKAIRDAAVKAL